MEKSFDEITVSSLSDLRLGSSSAAGVTIPEFVQQQQQQSSLSSFLRETSQLSSNSSSQNNNSNNSNSSQQRNSSGSNGNENNLSRQKKSPKQIQQQPVFNTTSKHLDVWLANTIRGLDSNSLQDPSDQLDSPTLKGSFAESFSLPPNLSYLDVPNSSSSTAGLFSPTQQQQQQQQLHQQTQSPVPGVIQPALPHQYRFGGVSNFLANDGSEFASLPPRISHYSPQPFPQSQHLGRKGPATLQNQSSSFQDLLQAQRIMTDSYINDSSDNESKNSCAKSKHETAESLLADLNMLNSATVNNGSGSTSGNGALNGTSAGNSGINTNSSNNNLVLVLLKEISKLHETNKKICRNLHETKVEMEALKHAPHWGLSHRRDSISGLSTNSQPVGMRYNSFGLQSPAPTYHSQGNYTPGIVSDVVREIREVSRVREEALMDRMKTMIEERSWALNEANFRLLKETEEMKKSIHSVRSEMNQIVDRMLKLENEVINLKAQLTHQQQVQSFALRERDSFGPSVTGSTASAAASKLRRNSLHLNYGRISNTEEFYGNNYSDVSNDLRYSNGSNMRKFGENNFGSTLNGGGFGEEMHDDSSNDQVLLLEKDALKLRRELQDALASKQESENRITALENIVSTLKEQVPPATTISTPHHTTAVHHPQLTNPAGLGTSTASSNNSSSSNSNVGISSGTQQQQQHQQHSNAYYFLNSALSNTAPSQQHPPAAISPKLQKAAQIQSLASPSKQYMHLSTSAINVSGPVTDL